MHHSWRTQLHGGSLEPALITVFVLDAKRFLVMISPYFSPLTGTCFEPTGRWRPRGVCWCSIVWRTTPDTMRWSSRAQTSGFTSTLTCQSESRATGTTIATVSATVVAADTATAASVDCYFYCRYNCIVLLLYCYCC